MKLFKKIICVVMALCLAISVVGCGKDGSETKDGVTKLKMILVGERPAVFDEVWGKLNEMLRQDIGAEVEVEYYPYADLNQKYSLLFSSGEYVDIVFSADWIKYNEQAAKNSFMEITDEMLKKNAPKTYESLTEKQKNVASVNGKLFMIPHNALAYSKFTALIRGDLREKYGMPEITTTELFEEYLVNVADNDKTIIPLTGASGIFEFFVADAAKSCYLSTPKSTELYYDVVNDKFVKKNFTEEYVNQMKKTREFVEKGIIPADIIANTTTENMFENGKSATYIKNLDTTTRMAERLNASHPEWKVELCDFSVDVPKLATSCIANGLSIGRTSKNADKALQFIELLRNDKRYFDLTWYGIEGKHWEANGENGFVSLNSSLPANEQYIPGCVWGWMNEPLLRTDGAALPESTAILERWKTETIESDIYGFVFNDTNVKTELANITSVASQYGGPLYNGMIEADKIDAAIKEYQEKLEKAGMTKVYDEVNRQYEEYKKSLNK